MLENDFQDFNNHKIKKMKRASKKFEMKIEFSKNEKCTKFIEFNNETLIEFEEKIDLCKNRSFIIMTQKAISIIISSIRKTSQNIIDDIWENFVEFFKCNQQKTSSSSSFNSEDESECSEVNIPAAESENIQIDANQCINTIVKVVKLEMEHGEDCVDRIYYEFKKKLKKIKNEFKKCLHDSSSSSNSEEENKFY